MIKILQIASFSGFGGGERVMFDIVESLKDDFEFIVFAPKGVFLEKLNKLGIKTKEFKKQDSIGKIKEIKKEIKQERPDILHPHGTRAAIFSRLAVLGMKKRPKIVYTLHGFHIIRKPFLLRLPLIIFERFLNHLTDVLVCVSDADKKSVLKYKTISEKKIVVIKNGIDIQRFQIEKSLIEKKKREVGLENNFVITFVGRLHPQKDPLTILKALKIILGKVEDIKLLIVGTGPQRKSLEEKARKMGLENYVKFLGTRDDIPIILNLSDIVVLSSKWEGLPLVPLEAGASKKPFLGSDIEGIREAVIEGKTGFLFKGKKDLAQMILKLYRSKELRKKMGEKGFLFVLENFNKKKMAKNYKNLYQKIYENSY